MPVWAVSIRASRVGSDAFRLALWGVREKSAEAANVLTFARGLAPTQRAKEKNITITMRYRWCEATVLSDTLEVRAAR
jgi:hypothetical protein